MTKCSIPKLGQFLSFVHTFSLHLFKMFIVVSILKIFYVQMLNIDIQIGNFYWHAGKFLSLLLIILFLLCVGIVVTTPY